MHATSRRLPLLLGFLTAVGPLSTDMYLPAFPAIEAGYGLTAGSAQITLASWFAGLAVGQITQGTLSDRFGRRAPLIAGLLVYTLASIGCALAPSLPVLTALRFVAAFGGSASMVLPRAVIRDLATGDAAARLMSQLMLVMGAAPILAPGLGGLMLGVASWSFIFWFAAAHGAISLVLVWRFLPETLPKERRIRLGAASLVVRYGAILRERTFILHVAIGALAMFGLFAYLGGSTPVYVAVYGLSAPICGLLVGLGAAGYILGSQINPRLLHRHSMSWVLRVAVRVYLLATIVLTAFALVGGLGLWSVVLPIVVCMSCLGFVLPNATVGALSRQAANAGSASALMGTLQFVLAAVSGTLIGVLTDGTARPMAILMLIGAAAATVADARRSAGEPTR